MSDRELQALRQSVTELRRELAIRPVRIPPRGGTSRQTSLILAIIGGNTLSVTLQGIKYSAVDPTLTRAYDPNVDVTYPNGMGRAVLYTNGILTGYVLVRHNFPSYPGPVVAGQSLRVLGTVSVPWDDGSGHTGVLSCFTFQNR